jgi:acyl-CoA reductase-like NAD-dependent aldehyde dehydrogenase
MRVSQRIGLFIDNRQQDASGGKETARLSPLTGAPATLAAAATVADANRAVESAWKAFQTWSRTGPHHRRDLLIAAANALKGRFADFADAIRRETGSTEAWAAYNVNRTADILLAGAMLTDFSVGETIPSDRPGQFSFTLREPVGVILSIAPWNGPMLLAAQAIAAPVALGNTVVLKASEQSPASQLLMAEVFKDAGFPDGVLNVVTNDPADAGEIVSTLIGNPRVRRVNFTGSTKIGRVIAETAAKHLKPVLLELGGKAPFIILDDADLDEAVNAAAFGAFVNQGQSCMSTERIIVDRKIADAFVEKFRAKTETIPTGDPRHGNFVLSSLIDRHVVDRVTRLVDDAVKGGAKLVAGGKADGTIMQATIVDQVTRKHRIFYEETFAPVVAIVRADNDEDAVVLANDSEYGLTAAVFSRDIGRALAVGKRIEAGMVHINGATLQSQTQAPFGGMKASGYGRFSGRSVINEFTEERWFTIDSGKQAYPF